MSNFQKLRDKLFDYEITWSHCKRCELHKTAKFHVIGRGKSPADMLLVGEAPGSSEDLIGLPFVGRAGKLLQLGLDTLSKQIKFSYYITNIISCFPVQNIETRAFRQPEETEAIACRPRLVELLGLVKPKGIILLGKIAKKFSPPEFKKYKMIDIYHPSYLLRKGGTNSKDYPRWLAQMSVFIKEAMVQ